MVNRSCLRASAASGREDLLGGPAAEVATRRDALRARTLPAYYAPVWGHRGAGRQPQEPRRAGRAGGNGAPPNVFLNRPSLVSEITAERGQANAVGITARGGGQITFALLLPALYCWPAARVQPLPEYQ